MEKTKEILVNDCNDCVFCKNHNIAYEYQFSSCKIAVDVPLDDNRIEGNIFDNSLKIL